MRKKIFIGLLSYFLVLTFFSAFGGEASAQPRSKPNDRAKKLAAQGDQFYRDKDYRSAITRYAEAIVISSNYPHAHYWKGYAHHNLNEYDEAIEEMNTALKQGFPPIKVYEVRWEAHYMKKNFDAALSDVQEALRIEPSNNYFILALGDAYRMKGEFQEAITAYNKALPVSQNKGDIHYFIAASYFNLGEYAQQNFKRQRSNKK
jgi:serine/threonine-protein kinase